MITEEDKNELKMVASKVKMLAMKFWYIPLAAAVGVWYFFLGGNKKTWK